MKISQRFWNYWFGLYSVIADDGITFTMKHFFDEVQYLQRLCVGIAGLR
jgi:hypothetical protein